MKKKKKDKEARRKVYEKVNYTDFEKNGIVEMKKTFEEDNKNSKTPLKLPENWKESDWLKMCYTARFDYKKCMEKMRDHVTWRNDKENHMLDETSKKLLESGFIY